MLVRLYIIWCLLLLLAGLGNTVYVKHPNIDFKYLDKLVIAGSYTGISVYKDTDQLTQIQQSTSSIVSFSNDTLKLIGSSNVNGDIYDSCILLDTLYFAGNFTTANGITVNNIASINLTTTEIQPLKYGLDGPAYSIFCDTYNDQVFVGGSFIAPLDSIVNYSSSLSQFGGRVALWKDNQWYGLPWKGFDGPVYSIIKKSNTSTVFFGGKFDTTTDGQTSHAPASQPIAIATTGVTGFNTSYGSADPSSIICADENNTNPWILADNTPGTWQALFEDYSVNPSLLRIVNSKLDNHQTKEFSVRSLSDASVYEFTYLDPDTNTTKTCSTDCTLSNNPDVAYQDFRFTKLSLTSGIAIDIKSWYGSSGGLASVKIFQSEIFTYAARSDPTNVCLAKSDNSDLPRISTTGTWTTSSSATPYLMSTIAFGEHPTITFYPNLVESGTYEIFLYSPPCVIANCTDRTFVDIEIQQTPSISSNVTVSEALTDGITIFSGFFEVSDVFTPSLTLGLASNITVGANETVSIVAYAVQFVKDASGSSLSSIAEYDYEQTSGISWGPVNNMPYQSTIYSMISVNDSIFIGGDFTSTDTSGASYTNIVGYNTSGNYLEALQGFGVNGPVNTVIVGTEDLYIGGSFSTLSENSTTQNLNNVARYNIPTSSWHSLGGGVNGPVSAMNWLYDKETILVSGKYTQLLQPNDTAYSKDAAGTAYWNTSTEQFGSSISFPYLTGITRSALSHNSTKYFIGNIKSAQRYQVDDLSFTTSTSSDSLSFFNSFNPQGNQSNVFISTAYINKSSDDEMIILGGQFDLGNNVKNIAIFANDSWQGVQGSDWQGTANTMAVNDNLLFVGGNFTGSSSNYLAVFGLTNKTLTYAPQVRESDGLSYANVNVIHVIPQENIIIVGGSFGAIESAACVSICSMNIETFQWNTLGSGLGGDVVDVQYFNGALLVAGNITLNESPLSVARFDFSSNTWSSFGNEELPGPSQAISYDNATQSVYVSGIVDNTSYLRKWNGEQFAPLDQDLGAGSVISNLAMLPLAKSASSISSNKKVLLSTDNSTNGKVLLATGSLNLGSAHVSSAFYDEEEGWIPYLVTSTSDGESSSYSLKGLYYMDEPYLTPTPKHVPPTTSTNNSKKHMAVPLVILISIAISLGIVFLLVLLAFLVLYFKRKTDKKVNPTKPSAYYNKSPDSPEAILAMLNEKTPHEKAALKEKQMLEKTEKERTQFYNMANSTDQLDKSFLSFIPIAAVSSATRRAPSPPTHTYRQSHSYRSIFGSLSRKTASFSNIGSAAFAPIIKTNTTKSRPGSFTTPLTDIQRESNISSFYNNEYTNRPMVESPTNFSSFRTSEIGVAIKEGTNRSTITTTQPIDKHMNSFSNIPPSTTPTSAVSSQSEAVRWTTTPVANASTAIVKPISMIDSSDESSVAGSSLRASVNSKNYLRSMVSLHDDPLHRSISASKRNIQDLEPNPSITALPPSSNARWTNHQADNALARMKISREPTLDSYYGLSNASVASNPEGFWNDPDIVKFTSKNESDKQPQNTSLSSLAWPQINEYGKAYTLEGAGAAGAAATAAYAFKGQKPNAHHIKNDSITSQDDTKINTKVFRLSDAGSVTPIETQGIQIRQNSITSPVRWKTAKVGSPIETAHAPEILEPSSAAVTSRTGSFIKRQSEILNANAFMEDDPIPSHIKIRPTTPTRSFSDAGYAVGRASSRRMVEEYMSSRKDTVNKRSKHKSDFKSIMQTAMENNASTMIATEENPHLYYAKFDFVAREKGELGFEKNDPVIVVDSSDDIWWMGYKVNKSNGSYIRGVFPSNYVEVAVNLR